jgi:hypothetical protein
MMAWSAAWRRESFYFTTTTGNSATLFREFGRLANWWGCPWDW